MEQIMRLPFIFIFILTTFILNANNNQTRIFSKHEPLHIIAIKNIDENTVRLTAYAKYKRGAFTGSKDFNESVSLPEDLMKKGYKLYKREIAKIEGKGASLRDEEMEAFGYSYRLHISKPFIPTRTIKITIYLYAGTNPQIETLQEPQIISPKDNTTVRFNRPDSTNQLRYNGEGNLFRVTITNRNSGKIILRRIYKKQAITLKADIFMDGHPYVISVEQTDDSLRWSKPSFININIYFDFKICRQCLGTGKIECSFCHGSGEIVEGYLSNNTGQIYYSNVPCPHCGGSGHLTCPECCGRGWVYK